MERQQCKNETKEMRGLIELVIERIYAVIESIKKECHA